MVHNCVSFFGFYLLQVKTLLSSQLSLPCFADKMSALRLCHHKSARVYTCGTNSCRWGCACMRMQMIHGVGGRMGVCTKTAGPPPWPLCNSFFSPNSLANTCDITIISTATYYDYINKPFQHYYTAQRRNRMMNHKGLGKEIVV